MQRLSYRNSKGQGCSEDHLYPQHDSTTWLPTPYDNEDGVAAAGMQVSNDELTSVAKGFKMRNARIQMEFQSGSKNCDTGDSKLIQDGAAEMSCRWLLLLSG